MRLMDDFHSIPTTKHWHDKELHGAVITVEASTSAASKVMRLPALEHELEPITTSLCLASNQLGSAQVTF